MKSKAACKAIMFVGPSLIGARGLVPASIDVRPPAQCGDVLAAVEDGAYIIGIVDGYFETRPAVWHKEILFAMNQGIRVFGAASMGALRAAELHSCGMIGVGQIFEAYRSGRIDRDDCVAVSHAPAEMGYINLSESLINMQATLANAIMDGIIDVDQHIQLSEIAQALFFKERTWDELFRRAVGQKMPRAAAAEIKAWVAQNRVDVKAQDALELRDRMVAEIDNFVAGAFPRSPVVASAYLREMLEQSGWTVVPAGDGDFHISKPARRKPLATRS
jgi:hypothetical protein